MNARAARKPKCPRCGSGMDVIVACLIAQPIIPTTRRRNDTRPLQQRTTLRPAALCTGCEFCIEITTRPGATRVK